jgi:pimeloyl-ACP methyl ester carboxylesterase
MAVFILVHGAFHGAWCWTRLAPVLAGRGHRVIAPDLPGLGEDAMPPESATMQAGVDRLAGLIEGAGEPVVLVGHSLAGMVISQVAEALPRGVRRLVYLAALVPGDGQSLDTLMAAMTDPEQPAAPAAGHDGWEGAAQAVPWSEVDTRFYNDCSPADIAFARAHLRPQPNAPRLAAVHLTPARFGRVPRSFIVCAQDNAMPAFRRRINIASGGFEHVVSLPTGHSPFFSAPDQLAQALDGLARA